MRSSLAAVVVVYVFSGHVQAVALLARQPPAAAGAAGAASSPPPADAAGDAAVPLQSKAGPDLKHFLDGVPGVLRNSGERISGAVQNMLEVQGSIDDLKEDLATEYKLWKAKKVELVKDRDGVTQHIQEHEGELLAQKSARAHAERLRADLAAAVEDGVKHNATRDDSRFRWNATKVELKGKIAALEQEIEAERLQRSNMLNATYNETEGVLRLQQELQNDTLVTGAAVKTTEKTRAELKVNKSGEQSSLLIQAAAVRKQIEVLNKELRDQSRLLVEHRRLADQAAKVAAERLRLESQTVNCTDDLRRANDEVTALVQSAQADTVELQRCQVVDAENQRTKAQINACKAAEAR